MIALLQSPERNAALDFNLFAPALHRDSATFSNQVWRCHRTISDPLSHAEEVKAAKRSLLRELRGANSWGE
jgi:hypothetical protein